jgi:phenylalanyl-tRNA synthetase beta chain
LGFQQMISHSLRDKGPLDNPDFDLVGPRVPSSPDMAYLRNSLLPSLGDAAKRNGAQNLHLFEMGRVFGKGPSGYLEFRHLGLLSSGAWQTPDWQHKEVTGDTFFTLKGALTQIFHVAGVHAEFHDPSAAFDPRLHPTRQARIASAGSLIGKIGQLHPDIADELGLDRNTFVGELLLEPMFGLSEPSPKLKQISRNPSVRRDISILIDKGVTFERIEAAISDALGDLLEKKWLFDVYEGKGIPDGMHSLAIALQLRKVGENFTDEEANQGREKVVQALAALGGTQR